MSKYVVVGMPNEQHEPLENPPPGVPFVNPLPKNYEEPGVLIEKQTLANATERRDDNKPAGVPFTTLSPKNYPVVEKFDANPVSHESGEPRAIGKPHVVAPPPSNAERLQSQGKIYPKREV
jgi:hypothetical protein